MQDRIEIAYTDRGHGPPLVLIHGFPLHRGVWAPQVDAFGDSRRVIAPDLRGFGESPSGSGDGTAGAVSMERHADDVADLLEALGTGPAVVVGHSMGGYVAFAFARRHRRLLAGLVLVATRAVADSPEAAEGRRAAAEKVRRGGPGAVSELVEGMLPKMVAASADSRVREAAHRIMAAARPEGTIGALLGMAERPDSTGMLPGIDVPTLVVAGADDTLIAPTESEAIAAAIPDAELSILDRAGHLVTYERPRAFDRVLRGWLESSGLA